MQETSEGYKDIPSEIDVGEFVVIQWKNSQFSHRSKGICEEIQRIITQIKVN